MEEFKEFYGKSLDEAIQGACSYFDTPREKLEIDIVQDAKNGIFGLVGARKAIVRARRTILKSRVGPILSRDAASSHRAEQHTGKPRVPRNQAREQLQDDIGNRIQPPKMPDDDIGNRITPMQADSFQRVCYPPTAAAGASAPHFGNARTKMESPRKPYQPRHNQVKQENSILVTQPVHPTETDEPTIENPPVRPFSELDKEKLLQVTQCTARKIVSSILGETQLTVTLQENRVDIHVDCGDDSGLLIGREGQTLAALQYITSRIISRTMEVPVRIQFDVGDYRERQDDRLRELALALADRVRATGRPYSTRPISSYHRRLVHMTLQDDPDVQTRSSGEGQLKRVIIQRRRTEHGGCS